MKKEEPIEIRRVENGFLVCPAISPAMQLWVIDGILVFENIDSLLRMIRDHFTPPVKEFIDKDKEKAADDVARKMGVL